ncbi:MAG TPA: hypothetical protein VGI97_11105 [Gemmatimonadaceae bacterium]
MPSRISGRPLRYLAALAASAAVSTSCHNSVTETVLAVQLPGIIAPAATTTISGAIALTNGARARLRDMTAGTESSWLFGGLLGDEWTTSSTFVQNDEADERRISLTNSTVRDQFRTVNRARTAAQQAINADQSLRPTAMTDIGEMYFIRGFAEMQIAQDWCNGTPLSDASGPTIVFAGPSSNDDVFHRAIASFDTALTFLSATDATTINVKQAALVAHARAQLGINDIPGAATEVAGIPTSFSYDLTFAPSSGDNILWSQPASSLRYSVGDTIVKTSAGSFVAHASIPFGTTNDPRVPTKTGTTKAQDGSTFVVTTSIWQQSTTVSLVNGLDARLVEAEAFLAAGDIANYLATLNALRAAPPKIGAIQPAPMPALTDPGTATARQAQLFSEKAYWTFGRGQRLSDMRRLERQYGWPDAQVFPTGTHYRGILYGTDVNLPVPQDELNNNPLSGNGCTDRKP